MRKFITLYDGILDVQAIRRIVSDRMIHSDIVVYFKQDPRFDETGTVVYNPLAEDKVASAFQSKSLYSVNPNVLAEIFSENAGPDAQVVEALSNVVSDLSVQKATEVILYGMVDRAPLSYAALHYFERLLSILNFKVTSMLADYTKNEDAGMDSVSLLRLGSLPPTGDIIFDTDAFAVLAALKLANRAREYQKKPTKRYTISKIAASVDSFLPPRKGRTRGFMGTYKIMVVKAQQLVTADLLAIAEESNKKAIYYSLTPFGDLVISIMLLTNYSRTLPPQLRKTFLEEDSTIQRALEGLIEDRLM